MVLNISILLRLRHRHCQSERLTDRNETTTKKDIEILFATKKILFAPKDIYLLQKKYICFKRNVFASKEMYLLNKN